VTLDRLADRLRVWALTLSAIAPARAESDGRLVGLSPLPDASVREARRSPDLSPPAADGELQVLRMLTDRRDELADQRVQTWVESTVVVDEGATA